jgi:hypothetical protein
MIFMVPFRQEPRLRAALNTKRLLYYCRIQETPAKGTAGGSGETPRGPEGTAGGSERAARPEGSSTYALWAAGASLVVGTLQHPYRAVINIVEGTALCCIINVLNCAENK